ncbi:MAG: sialidase family protein [Bacillota bacterium]|nr:sialidase family protein [Bacillota bacterium]
MQALDIQLWTDPDGKLRVYWTQNNAIVDDESNASIEGYRKNGYIWCDNRHAAWTMVCDNPDDDNPVFSEPHYWGIGFLRCKPIVLDDGRWMFCNYDQLCDCYGYSISTDCGKTYERCYGGTKVQTDHDEPMAYQRKDGSIRMLARSTVGELGESISNDRGTSWSGGIPSGIESPNSRFWISRTPTGRILLVNNDHRTSRCRMSVRLSEDDGATWKYKRCVDEREALSYPDVEFCNGKILLTYDRERIGVREILFTSFTEDDIMNENYSFDISIACKPDAKK